jgi:hypothetical protein
VLPFATTAPCGGQQLTTAMPTAGPLVALPLQTAAVTSKLQLSIAEAGVHDHIQEVVSLPAPVMVQQQPFPTVLLATSFPTSGHLQRPVPEALLISQQEHMQAAAYTLPSLTADQVKIDSSSDKDLVDTSGEVCGKRDVGKVSPLGPGCLTGMPFNKRNVQP